MNPRRAFTLVELLVVIGIIAVLISILLPALNKAREQSQTVACLANLRQIGMAMANYTTQNKGYMVPSRIRDGNTETWATVLVGMKYLDAPWQTFTNTDMLSTPIGTFRPLNGDVNSVFRCPSGTVSTGGAHNDSARYNAPISGLFDEPAEHLSNGFGRDSAGNTRKLNVWYGINAEDSLSNTPSGGKYWPSDKFWLTPFRPDRSWDMGSAPNNITTWRPPFRKASQIKNSSNVVAVYDGMLDSWFNQWCTSIAGRHNKRTVTNLLFLDGHAEPRLRADLPYTTQMWSGFNAADIRTKWRTPKHPQWIVP